MGVRIGGDCNSTACRCRSRSVAGAGGKRRRELTAAGGGVYTHPVTRLACRRLCWCALIVLDVAPLAAHHVIAAKFDTAKKLTLRGPITEIDWANPHAHVFVNVADANGRFVNWAIELESPVDLRRQGWTASTVRIGDVVTVDGIAARDGSTQ